MITVVTTDAHLTIQSWEEPLTPWTGIAADQVCGLPLWEVIPDWDQRQLALEFEPVLTRGITVMLDPVRYGHLLRWNADPLGFRPSEPQQVTIAPLYHTSHIVGTIITLTTLNDPTPPTAQCSAVERQPQLELIAHVMTLNPSDRTAQLVELIRREHRNPTLLNRVLHLLTEREVDPLPALLIALQDDDPEVRLYSALALGHRGDQRAIAPLLTSLHDPNINVCCNALEALGHLHALEAIPALVSLATSEHFFVAFSALQTLFDLCKFAETGTPTPNALPQSLHQHLLPLFHKTLHWQVRRTAVDQVAICHDPDLLPELMNLLRHHHQNPDILNSVLQILTLSELDPLPILLICLGDRDPNVRIYTALALGERGDPRAVEPLLACLDDPDINVRYHAIEALGRLADPIAVEALMEIVVAEDFFLAFPALEALTRIGDPSIAPHLIPLLQLPLLLSPVVTALGNFGDSLVMRPLVRCVNRGDSGAMQELVVAIEQIYHRYQHHYGEGDYIMELTVTTLNRVGRQNLMAAARRFQGQPLQAVVRILGWLPGEGIDEFLVDFLARGETRSRVMAAIQHRGQRLAPLLVERLAGWDGETCQGAATLLGQMGYGPAVSALVALVQRGDGALVEAVTMALAQIGDRAACTALLTLLHHEDETVCTDAIQALTSLPCPDFAAALLPAFTDPNPQVRAAAVRVAGDCAFPLCQDALLAAAQDPDEAVRQVAIAHLPRLNHAALLPTLTAALRDPWPSIRAAALCALGELSDLQILPWLMAACDDGAAAPRCQALQGIEALMPHLPAPDRAALLERVLALAQTDPDPTVQGWAIALLGAIDHRAALPLLTELAAHTLEAVAQAAILALGQISHPTAIAPLLTLLHSEPPSRRLAALQALRHRGGPEATGVLQWLVQTDPDVTIVKAAMEFLVQIGTVPAIATLLDLTLHPLHRNACCDALTQSHPHRDRDEFVVYINAIATGLNHAKPTIRAATIDILARLKHTHATEYLIKTLHSPDETLRLAAVRALITLGKFPTSAHYRHLNQDPSLPIRQTVQAYFRR